MNNNVMASNKREKKISWRDLMLLKKSKLSFWQELMPLSSNLREWILKCQVRVLKGPMIEKDRLIQSNVQRGVKRLVYRLYNPEDQLLYLRVIQRNS